MRSEDVAATLVRLRRAGPFVAAALGVAIVALDIVLGERIVLIGLLSLCPLLVGVTAGPQTTAWFAAAAIGLVALSGIWDNSYDDWYLWVPLSVVSAASAVSMLTAVLRDDAARELSRMEMLAELAAIVGGGRTVEEAARAAGAIAVPRLGDVCLFQVVGPDGELRPLDVRTGGEAIPELASAVSVELRARERRLGVLTIGRGAGRRPLDDAERRFVEGFADRVALALDNAALSAQLSTTEQQLAAILTQVGSAIIVRDVHGRVVFANQAAADLLGLPDVGAIESASPAELMGLFEVYDEDGAPVALTDLPGTRVLTGEDEPAPMTVRNIIRSTGRERWLVNRATAVRDESGRVVMAVNVIDDVTATKRRELGQRLLAEALRALSSSLELDETLEAVAEMAVPGLADWAGVDLLGQRGELRAVAIAHRDPEKARLGRHLRDRWPSDPDAEGGLAGVVRSGAPELIPEVTDEMLVAGAVDEEHLEALRGVGLRSIMIVPMQAGDEVVGALSFASSTARRFDAEDLELAVDLGRQAGVAVRNAQLFTERRDIAHTLQTGLLPEALPEIPGWDIAAFYRPAGLANEAGGDFYDAVRGPRGWVLAIGDVAGKGAVAAAIAAVARYTLRSAIQLAGDPVRALRYLNDVLVARDELSLCTLALVGLPDDGSEVEIVVAGHPLPLRRGGADSEVDAVGATGPMLGAVADPVWEPRRVALSPDETLLLYTDGVPDTVGADGRFGATRLQDALRDAGRTADDVVAGVRDATDAFRDGPEADDMAVLVVRRAPLGTHPTWPAHSGTAPSPSGP